MFEMCGVFIFTLGLTEAWLYTERRVVYPMCPGTVAGTFDAARHAFKSYAFNEIIADLSDVFDLVRQVNRGIRCLLTVSPVPLTATATTVHSKSILRAVAGQLAASRPNVDYFPSYEIVSAFPFKGAFYEPNMRCISKFGVDFVMQRFFNGLTSVAPGDVRSPETAAVPPERGAPGPAARDEVCEDMILDAFWKLKP
ncbi:GSCFA domain-containing protein [Burkholderia mayonis]|nr:GSCFA domain-containing protein [Burkholderia mayonis]